MKTSIIKTSLGLVAGLALALTGMQANANNTTHSLLGIDVSSYQGYITWNRVYGDGVRFAIAKATEGTSWTDADFAGNMSRGKTQGLKMGAYHFCHPEADC